MLGFILFFAALPPLIQEAKEIKAILDDPRLSPTLKSEMIQRIEKNEEGYLLTTESQQVQIRVHYLPNKVIGPAKFEILFP